MEKCSLAIADGKGKILNYVCQFSFTKKISQKEFKSSSFALCLPLAGKRLPKGEGPNSPSFCRGRWGGIIPFSKG